MFIRHKYIKNIIPFIDKPLIKVITGMRRTGKSTLLRQLQTYLKEHGAEKNRIVYINMESMENLEFADVNILYEYIKERRKKVAEKLYLLIDEVQEIEEWERLTNSLLADDQADIFITGSNSKLLSGELATLLTGRHIEFNVYPLVYSEYVLFRAGESKDEDTFYDFLKYGGMPGIHQLNFDESQIYQYLSAVRDSLLLKDVIKRHNIRNAALLEKILLFVFDNIGNIFSARKIADYFKKEQRAIGHETVYNYLHHLEEACIINKAARWDLKGKRLMEVSEKYYLTDIGLNHAFGGYKPGSINAYLENIVYIELLYRGYDVFIGKAGDYEIDFIARRKDETVYIQVCYLLADENVIQRETHPFYKLKDNYPKYLLTMDKTPEGNLDGIIRRYIPAWLLDYKF